MRIVFERPPARLRKHSIPIIKIVFGLAKAGDWKFPLITAWSIGAIVGDVLRVSGGELDGTLVD